ncbi:MAG: hypothetical protein FWC70_00795 [Defluviitaleaceae bacterium]|nr:hypothetical protein [Defluviitaleaceae bacterium]
MSYQLNRIHLLISVLAGVVIAGAFVWTIFFDMPRHLFTMTFWVSITIVVFYFVGHFVRSYLLTNVFVPLENTYNFAEDEEYQAFVASLENQELGTLDVMTEEPLEIVGAAGFIDPVDPLAGEFDDEFALHVPDEAL